jgi:hypothetical protein
MFTEIELLESPDLIPLDFCLWSWMQSEVYERCGYTRQIARSRFGCCCLHKECKIDSDEKRVIFAFELQIALKLTVGFLSICCEL